MTTPSTPSRLHTLPSPPPPEEDEEELDRNLDRVIGAVIHSLRQPHVRKRREEKEEPDDDLAEDMEKLFITDPSIEPRLEKLDRFFKHEEKPPEEIGTLVQHFQSMNDSNALILSPPMDKSRFNQVLKSQRRGRKKERQFKEGEEERVYNCCIFDLFHH